ncbi:hypothetical protein RM780_13990 [Streptomyces sp. DSM 44917]|uniref:Uncharacterized protein n=1 Tax=Streptomyces boetiae TaxID=3075541 RepID=A0ABU2L9A9_9ACTN|nr:hypothetical protein [Streptomyces sp. DSM 44917]MDT0308066.1 hypothetical protein [Streptomyces sp. DSM 44917]
MSTNYGIQSTGGFLSGVQNQVGNYGSQQVQVTPPADDDALPRLINELKSLRPTMEENRDGIDDYQQCLGMLDLVERHDPADPVGRSAIRTALSVISEKCGGAPGVSTLIASTLSLIATIGQATL